MEKADIIKFNNKLYNPESLKTAIRFYKEFAKFKLAKRGNYTEVFINYFADRTEKNLIDEFKNYALFLNIEVYKRQ